MTELLINGYQVVLPKDFACTVKTENPILTKNGEYTYDITLSLGNDANKRVFGHLDRINNDYEKEWSAVLISSNEVLLNGKAIYISNSDTELSIQLLSGNSELNYLIGSDKLISSLDLGSVGEITKKTANDSTKGKYPEWNYVVTPIYKDRVINEYKIDITSSEYEIIDRIPQPYMMYYIEKIPLALGYTIEQNALRDSIFMSMLYILNTSNSDKFKDYIPGWTVSEFITEVEKFCNVVFVVDKNSKRIRILNYANIASNFPTKSIIRSIDSYVCEFNPDGDQLTSNYSSVGYDLPETEYFKYQSIKQEIIGSAEIKKYNNFSDLYNSVKNDFDQLYNQNIIYEVTTTDSQYIVDLDGISEPKYLRRINMFSSVGIQANDEEPTVIFKIVPAEIKRKKYTYPSASTSQSYNWWGFTQMPVCSNSIDDTEPEIDKIGIIDKIKESQKSERKIDRIECALYFGRVALTTQKHESISTTPLYPLSINDYLLSYVTLKEIEVGDGWITSWGGDIGEYTFRLNTSKGRYKRIYSKNASIDNQRRFELSFPVNCIVDPRSIFIIKNKSFICKEIEYSLNVDSIGTIAKGVFYPYELNAVETAWILSDGTWLDAGVWNDGGKWLDQPEEGDLYQVQQSVVQVLAANDIVLEPIINYDPATGVGDYGSDARRKINNNFQKILGALNELNQEVENNLNADIDGGCA